MESAAWSPLEDDEFEEDIGLVCLICGSEFDTRRALLNHYGGEPGTRAWYCVCGGEFCSTQALRAHAHAMGHLLDPSDSENYNLCPRCGRSFRSEHALRAHCGGDLGNGENDSDDNEPLWCSCGRAFCSPQALVAHVVNTGHEQEVLYDQDSDFSYDGSNDFEEHNNLERGLSEAAVSALPRRSITSQDKATRDPITCEALCGPTVIALSCGHVFDEPMLLRWFQSRRTCPVCRHEVEA